MRRVFLPVLWIVVAASSFSAAQQYFPAMENTTWQFNFTRFDGHGSGGTHQEGKVTWEIINVTSENGITVYTVNQTRSLDHKYYSYFDPSLTWDSVFQPPRLTTETFTLIDSAHVIKKDGIPVMVSGLRNENRNGVCLIDTPLTIEDQFFDATAVITGSCDQCRGEWSYFMQSPGYGLVGWAYSMQYFLLTDFYGNYCAEPILGRRMSSYSQENWVLTGQTFTIEPVAKKYMPGKRWRCIAPFGKPEETASSVYDLRGVLQSSISSTRITITNLNRTVLK